MDGLGRADISSPMTHRGPLPCPSPVALSPEKALVLNQMPGGWGDCGHGQKTAASDAWAIDLPPNKESGVGGVFVSHRTGPQLDFPETSGKELKFSEDRARQLQARHFASLGETNRWGWKRWKFGLGPLGCIVLL